MNVNFSQDLKLKSFQEIRSVLTYKWNYFNLKYIFKVSIIKIKIKI